MNGQSPTGRDLRIVRLALLGGVLIFGMVIAWLTGREGFVPDEEYGRMLRLVFMVLTAGALVALAAVRGFRSRAAPGQRSGLAIAGWALGEGVALFGGVAWLIAGERILYLSGLALLLIAFLLVPVPADS
jgi:hypothetical protein